MEDRELRGRWEDTEMDFKQIDSEHMAQIKLDKYRFQWRHFVRFSHHVRVKLSLGLIKHAMRTDRGMEVWLHAVLTSALVGGEWSDSLPYRLPPGIWQTTYWKGAGWALEPVWTLWGREKCVALAGNRNMIPRSSSLWPSHYIYTLVVANLQHL
jgi:hypothetical protein